MLAYAFRSPIRDLLQGPPPKLVGWETDIEKAKTMAAANKRPILAYFNATWCGPCKELKRDVFTSREFADLSKAVVLLEVDVDKQPELAQRFGVNGIPDLRLLNQDGTERTKLSAQAGAIYSALRSAP